MLEKRHRSQGPAQGGLSRGPPRGDPKSMIHPAILKSIERSGRDGDALPRDGLAI
jgi:hypothetical protein